MSARQRLVFPIQQEVSFRIGYILYNYILQNYKNLLGNTTDDFREAGDMAVIAGGR